MIYYCIYQLIVTFQNEYCSSSVRLQEYNIHFRGSQRQCLKNCVLKNFTSLTRKHLCWSLFSITLQAFNSLKSIKRPLQAFQKRLQYKLLLAKFLRFLRTSFLQNTPGRLLLKLFDRSIMQFKTKCLEESKKLNQMKQCGNITSAFQLFFVVVV